VRRWTVSTWFCVDGEAAVAWQIGNRMHSWAWQKLFQQDLPPLLSVIRPQSFPPSFGPFILPTPLSCSFVSLAAMNSDKRSVSDLAVVYDSQIKGKTILVMGVTPGSMGAAFALGIAGAKPALLILAGRNPTKVQETAQAVSSAQPDVQVRSVSLDLVSLAAVRSAAETINGWTDVPQIDVVVNSAGVMAPDWALSPDGYDSQLAINHLGPFLFVNLLMDKILKAPAPRVVCVTSDGHRLSAIRFDDYNFRVRLPPAAASAHALPAALGGTRR
jgi:hypothetical protein